MLVVLMALVAPAAQAPKWEVTASLFVVEKPRIYDSWVSAQGIHLLTVTSFTVADSIWPTWIQITKGSLKELTFTVQTCSTAKYAVYETGTQVDCVTTYFQDPCYDTNWNATTRGQVTGHPSGGIKTANALPVTIVCCV